MTTCTYGNYRRVGSTTLSPDFCGAEATGYSEAGAERCDEHAARRWLVTFGSSITLTKGVRDREDGAKLEVVERMAGAYPSLTTDQAMDRMTARPATEDDVARWEALVAQDKAHPTKKSVQEVLAL